MTFKDVVLLVCFGVTFLLGAIAGAHNSRPLPICQEDQVYIGGGNYQPHKGWDWLQCGPARDDITPREFDWSR